MTLFLYVLCGILMAVGFVELLRLLSFWAHRGARKGPPMILVVAPQSPEDCEPLVRAAAGRIAWMALDPPCRLVCLDPGTGEETARLLQCLKRDYPAMEVLPAGAMSEIR